MCNIRKLLSDNIKYLVIKSTYSCTVRLYIKLYSAPTNAHIYSMLNEYGILKLMITFKSDPSTLDTRVMLLVSLSGGGVSRH